MSRRLFKELQLLLKQQNSKPLLENDYIIHFDESDLTRVYALIKCPYDSVYRHKFIKLKFEIPEDYPHSPPAVNFVNHDSVRIHPNMYESGKCCATILNTWGDDKFEKWTSSMGLETILVMFHSFLDWNPYMHEPGGRDDPHYSVYVQHQTWISCLIRYLQYEKIPLFNTMIHNYLLLNLDTIIDDLYKLNEEYPRDYYNCRCFEIDDYEIDYMYIIYTLQNFYNYIEYRDKDNSSDEFIMYDENEQFKWNCEICFDTSCEIKKQNFRLHCTHIFHKDCLKQHIDKNSGLCPMCRSELSDEEITQLTEESQQNSMEIQQQQNSMEIEQQQNSIQQNQQQQNNWMINPFTRRRIKIGGRTWQYLIDSGLLVENENENDTLSI